MNMKNTAWQPVEIARRIVVNPQVRFGQPVIKGTRVPVALLPDELAAGSAFETIAKEYSVTQADISAVIRLAKEHVATEAGRMWSAPISASRRINDSFSPVLTDTTLKGGIRMLSDCRSTLGPSPRKWNRHRRCSDG